MKRAGFILGCAVLSLALAADTRTTWDGVYTQEQAKRGEAAYNDACVTCHSQDLGGSDDAPSLAGEGFFQRYEGRPIADLYKIMASNMPLDDPGSLGEQQYSDIVSFILRENKFPAGKMELPADVEAMQSISIQSKKK